MKQNKEYQLAMKARKHIMNSHLVKIVEHPNIHGNCITSLSEFGVIDGKTINIHAWFKSN